MKNTSWQKTAIWDEYQKELILPNLLRLVSPKKGDVILDLGCGPGLFAHEFSKKGARMTGVDISPELVTAAKKNSPASQFFAASADNLSFLKGEGFNKIVLILAIQNINNVHQVFKECRRLLTSDGKLYLVMNHPAFRIPQQSNWDYDPSTRTSSEPQSNSSGQAGKMYRRVDKYMSEEKIKILMNPSAKFRQTTEQYTISFHRPLQFYFKLLNNNGFGVTRLEEWISNKKSEPGPRAEAENIARKEIPLFLFLEATKI